MRYLIKHLDNYLRKDFYKNYECWTNNRNNAGIFTAFEVQLIKDRFLINVDVQIIRAPSPDLNETAKPFELEQD